MHTLPRTRRAALAAGAGLLTLWLAAAAPAQAATDLVIGQVAPITGVIAGTGNEYVAGAAAYFAQVNAKGGINGRKIRVVLRDDAYKPAATVEHTKEILAKENPIALFGFIGTANVAALQKNKLLSDAKIALLAPYTGAQELRDPMDPHLFHIRASYGDETASMVEHLHTIGLRRFAVFHQNDGFGKNGLDGAVSALKKLGLEPAAVGHYERTKPNEVDEAVSRIVAAKPDAVIMVSVNRASAAFIKKLRAAGSRARLFSISVVNFKELLKNAGEDMARGVGIAQVMPYPYTPSSPVAREFLAAMKQHQPEATISYASIEGFIAARVLVEAIRRTGAEPTRERVLAALETLRDFDVGGFRTTFSRDDHVGSGFVDVTVIGRDGRLLR